MATTWRVVPPQRFFDELTPGGTFVPMVEVTFEIIATGSQGAVKVAERDYTRETVAARIEDLASRMIGVENL